MDSKRSGFNNSKRTKRKKSKLREYRPVTLLSPPEYNRRRKSEAT